MKLSGDFDLITSSVLHCPRNIPMRNKVGITGIAYEIAAMVLLEEWNIVVVFSQEKLIRYKNLLLTIFFTLGSVVYNNNN